MGVAQGRAPAPHASASKPRSVTPVDRWGILLLPALAFLLMTFALPLAFVIVQSITKPHTGLGNYREALTSPLYLHVLANTFIIAFAVTAATLVIGYLYAYLMTLAPRLWRNVLLIAVLLPFWTSLLIRSFAWILLLRDTGAVNSALQGIGLVEHPVPLIRNMAGVVIGMVQVMLPFAVLPLYASMRGIDRGLLHAAEGLGARPVLAFWRIFVPLTVPGLAAASLLVFIQSLGFYITPALLGGPHSTMLSQLIVDQVSTTLRWGFASALAVILLITTGLFLLVASRFLDLRRLLRTMP